MVSSFPRIHLLDTAVSSDNIGDEIIVRECRKIIDPLLAGCYVTTSSSHDGFNEVSRGFCKAADIVVLLGTNALAPFPQQRKRFIWHIADEDMDPLKNKVVCFGVGANKAFDTVSPKQADFLSRILKNGGALQSVRDGLGADIVHAAGGSAINTSCPTLWSLPTDPKNYAQEKSANVCFTLTKHKGRPKEDIFLIETLKKEYERVFFWPQQLRDLAYLRDLAGLSGIEVIPPNLDSYDEFLRTTETDVVGTRLHGTIRGLHFGRRALVVAIDNRTLSIGEEVKLNYVRRSELNVNLEGMIRGPLPFRISLPQKAIHTFTQNLTDQISAINLR